ncbi:MAG TPA: Fur family transcriptional regulator [Acidimicrobiales bacterium]|nr:Fur family transcriptional regulator [Acidimicrobiales bacterium]
MRDLDALAAALHESGLRVTPQRQMIYALLAGSGGHPTVDAVHEAVSQVLPTVSLRTVYQALHDFAKLGEIRLVPLGGSSLRVDVRTDDHAHMVCVGCGQVQDVDVDPATFVPVGSERHGFTIDRTDVVFSGRCVPCRDAERGSSATTADAPRSAPAAGHQPA